MCYVSLVWSTGRFMAVLWVFTSERENGLGWKICTCKHFLYIYATPRCKHFLCDSVFLQTLQVFTCMQFISKISTPPRMVRPELHGHEAMIVRPFNPDIRATDNQSVWIIFYPPCCNWASYPEVCSKLIVKTDCKSNKRHDELTSSFSASRFHSRTTGWNLFRNKDEWRSFHQSKVLVFYH